VEILKLPLVGIELEDAVRSGANPFTIGSSPEAAKLPLPFGSDSIVVAVVIANGLVAIDGLIAVDSDDGAIQSGMPSLFFDGDAILFECE